MDILRRSGRPQPDTSGIGASSGRGCPGAKGAAWRLTGRVVAFGLFAALATATHAAPDVRDGDVVFQTSRSAQSLAVQRATRSKYSHMGMVVLRDGKPFVFEAVAPVKVTPLAQWTARGVGGHYVVKRLKDADVVLDADAVGRLRTTAEAFLGRPYDLTFEWTDDRLYCSEVVWKVYDRALGLRLGRLQKVRDLDVGSSRVDLQACKLEYSIVSPK